MIAFMPRGVQKLGLSAIMVLFMSSVAGAQAQPRSQAALMPPFAAKYSVSWSGIGIAGARFSLRPPHNGIYAYRVKTFPTGVASLFSSDTVIEVSRFILDRGKLQPLSYHYRHTDGDKLVKQQIIYFDWAHDVAHTFYKGKRSNTPLPPHTTDLLLGQLHLSLDMAAGHLKDHYPILNKGKLSTWHLRNAGHKRVKTSAGEYMTIKLVRKDPDSGKVATLWLAPRLNYLPVKMTRQDPDGPDYDLELTSFHSNPQHSGPRAKTH